MPKELPDALWLTLRAPKSRTNVAKHFLLVARTSATVGVALDVVVQEFVGIQVGTVRREEVQPQHLPMLPEPGLEEPSVVPAGIVDDDH
jgi:hypothetical protein